MMDDPFTSLFHCITLLSSDNAKRVKLFRSCHMRRSVTVPVYAITFSFTFPVHFFVDVFKVVYFYFFIFLRVFLSSTLISDFSRILYNKSWLASLANVPVY